MASKNMTTKPEGKKEDLENVSEALSRSEQFIENNQKTLLIALVAICVLVAGVLLYSDKVVAPREKAASEQLYKGEYYFSIDSLELALHGDAIDFAGFEQISKDYKGTKAASLAKAYAGLCYKEMGDYEQAIAQLNKVKSKDIMVSPALVGAVGDCYVELEDYARAVTYFEKAASEPNNLLAPLYRMKAGLTYEAMGQYAKALKMYAIIKNEYPLSQEGVEIEKYIERAKLSK